MEGFSWCTTQLKGKANQRGIRFQLAIDCSHVFSDLLIYEILKRSML
jgi:hypothetical protein